ncbi:MAG: DUF3237 domain-containing protein [Pseudomonadales bacterium]
MKLEPLMTLYAMIGESMPVGDGGVGNRTVANVTGGHFEGPRLRGRVLDSGADWVIVDSAGIGRIDVRIVLATEDGANVYVSYQGLLEYNDAILGAFGSGGSTEFGDAIFLTQLRFETGHPDYAWLNRTLAVAEGRLRPGAVEYRVYQLVAGN